MKMQKYEQCNNLAYAASTLRNVTVKKGIWYEEDRCQKMGRRKKMHEDKRDNAKVTQKP